ncbi:MAG: shikimate kinase [Candidatus Thalassarchaeaceae archaeon]|nr:shikimate kinase [Candidatus Thalassarchaeaceae archaeon]
MAGVGKSHIAKKIAAVSNYEYVETDKLIAEQANEEGMRYHDLSDSDFLRIEKDVFRSLRNLSGKIIDTGASVIYDCDIMCKIAELGHIIYIKDDINVIVARFNARGKVPLMGIEGKTFEQLFVERKPLYEKYAQSTVTRNSLRNNDAQLVAEQILEIVKNV